MNTPGRPLPTSIEILESRIAPAAITFTDFDGDRVKITVSKGTSADIRAAAHISGGQLLELDLASNPIFADADVTSEKPEHEEHTEHSQRREDSEQQM